MDPEAHPYFSDYPLDFSPVEAADLDQIRLLRNDRSTWTHLTDPRPLTAADQKAWLDSLTQRSGRFYFTVRHITKDFIGLVRMDEYDPINRSIRVGADVVQTQRGHGYGIKIYQALKRYCFDTLNVHRLWLAVLSTNDHAIRLYEKQGFKIEGRYREAVFRDGKYVDYILMSILDAEYRVHG